MRTIVVQGGTDGIGRAVAEASLDRGDRVVVLGRDVEKAARMRDHARSVDAEERLQVVVDDLSSIAANRRAVEQISHLTQRVDALVLCARHYSTWRRESVDGLESTFALFYLSRYLLLHGLTPLLRRSAAPVVVDVAGSPGTLAAISWDDLQLRHGYDGQRALMQGGAANDLLVTAFAADHDRHGVAAVLVDPGMVSSSFSGEYDDVTAAQIRTMQRLGRPTAEAATPVLDLLERPPTAPISALARGTAVPTTRLATIDPPSAARLAAVTERLLDTAGRESAWV